MVRYVAPRVILRRFFAERLGVEMFSPSPIQIIILLVVIAVIAAVVTTAIYRKISK